MSGSVIVAGARTPMGRLLGSLKDFSGADLGGFAIEAALERAGVAPEQVEYVIMGQVLQAGAGQNTAPQAAAMGESTERYNARLGISREDQDAFSALSHQRAAEAAKNGVFDDEIVPVEIPQRKGDPIVFSTDEGVRADTTADLLAKLRPAFAPDGTITAGSSSQISDGGAAVVVMSRQKAESGGLPGAPPAR